MGILTLAITLTNQLQELKIIINKDNHQVLIKEQP